MASKNRNHKGKKRDLLLNKLIAEQKADQLGTNPGNESYYITQGLWPVGKYKGTPIKEIPKAYLEYIVKTPGSSKKNSKPTKASLFAQKELNRRHKAD